MAIVCAFQKIGNVQKVTHVALKRRIPAERGQSYLNVYRSDFFKCSSFQVMIFFYEFVPQSRLKLHFGYLMYKY